MIRRSCERLNANPRGRDAVLAVCWLIVGLGLLQLGAYPLWAPLAVFHTSGTAFLIILLAFAALTTQRSRSPFLALAAAVPLLVADVLFGGSLGAIIIFTDLIYAAVKYGSDRQVRLLIWIMIGSFLALLAFIAIWFPDNPTAHVVAVQWVLILVVATLWGWNVRSERLRTSARLAQVHVNATQQLRQRIAHDLHDLVANQVAVTGLHVEAATLQLGTLRSPSHAAATRHHSAPAADTKERTLQALAESLDQAALGASRADSQLRRMIHVLQAVDDLNAQPELPVELLVQKCIDEADHQLPGERHLIWVDEGAAALHAACMQLPPAHARLALRVLHELIANAGKHGVGDVEVQIQRGSIERVTVRNSYLPGTTNTRGSGIGISGASMLLEGTGMHLNSGPAPATQWNAELTLHEIGSCA